MLHDDIYTRIESLWKKILGVSDVKMSACFFAMGGDQLLFSLLLTELVKAFSIECDILEREPLTKFYQQLNFFREKLNCKENIVVSLNDIKSTNLFVFIHPIGGTLFVYHPLLKVIKGNGSILGLQDSFSSGYYRLYESIEQQAEIYIKNIKQVSEINSITIFGYSYGATVAIEMASQLFEQNIKVNHLVMFDGWAKIPFDRNFKSQLRNIAIRQVEKLNTIELINKENIKEAWLELLWQRAELLLGYKPREVPIDMTLFSSSESVAEYNVNIESIDGWKKYVNDLRVYKVPGNHETMLNEENIEFISSSLNKLLV